MSSLTHYPIWKPASQQWMIETRECDDAPVQVRHPTPAEAKFLDAHRVEAYEKEAQRQLRVNRVLMSDPVVIQALRNLRDARL